MTKKSTASAAYRFVVNPSDVDLTAVSRLMATVGMRKRDRRTLKRALAASSDVVVAHAGDELIGFGRMISDGVYYGSIWDVAVVRKFQDQGIGSRILELLLSCATKRRLYMVGLFTAAYNRAFYERMGFQFHDDIHAMTRESSYGKASSVPTGKHG
jgi:ribosomal protein S18 acetylase RimI-like enzyme